MTDQPTPTPEHVAVDEPQSTFDEGPIETMPAPNAKPAQPPRVSPVGRPQPKREDDGVQPVTGL